MKCSNCNWWAKHPEQIEGDLELGDCKRYPPNVFSESINVQYTNRPITKESDDCGEWTRYRGDSG